MGFIVHRPGTYSLLVDRGQPSTRHLGIPMGGPADRGAWRLGNALVGNHTLPFSPPSQGGDGGRMCALEMTLHGPTLEATESHALVVVGAEFPVKIMDTADNLLQSLSPGHTFGIETGQRLSIGIAHHKGLRAYLCVAGGWIGCPNLSLPIQAGAKLECGPLTPTLFPRGGEGRVRGRWVQVDPWPNASSPGVLRYLPVSKLPKRKQAQLEKTEFMVRAESNRMGLRLESAQAWDSDPPHPNPSPPGGRGKGSPPSKGGEAGGVSVPVVPGTIQHPNGGQPIVLGVDAQTIGGYPRLGYVISADLDQLGQLRPGDSVRFESISPERAESLRQDRETWLRSWTDRLRW